eukprot:3831905-Prymnesium_polylepis.1
MRSLDAPRQPFRQAGQAHLAQRPTLERDHNLTVYVGRRHPEVGRRRVDDGLEFALSELVARIFSINASFFGEGISKINRDKCLAADARPGGRKGRGERQGCAAGRCTADWCAAGSCAAG